MDAEVPKTFAKHFVAVLALLVSSAPVWAADPPPPESPSSNAVYVSLENGSRPARRGQAFVAWDNPVVARIAAETIAPIAPMPVPTFRGQYEVEEEPVSSETPSAAPWISTAPAVKTDMPPAEGPVVRVEI